MSTFGKAADLEFIAKQAKSLFAGEVYKETMLNTSTVEKKQQVGVFTALERQPGATAMDVALFMLMPGKKVQLAVQAARALMDSMRNNPSLSDATKAWRTTQEQSAQLIGNPEKIQRLPETFGLFKQNLDNSEAQKLRRAQTER